MTSWRGCRVCYLIRSTDSLVSLLTRFLVTESARASSVIYCVRKFAVSTSEYVGNVAPSEDVVKRLLVELVTKHEVRISRRNDVYDLVVAFLSGDANDEGHVEISWRSNNNRSKSRNSRNKTWTPI